MINYCVFQLFIYAIIFRKWTIKIFNLQLFKTGKILTLEKLEAANFAVFT